MIQVASFACAVVGAVHQKILILTTIEFLMVFRRFTSRCGIYKFIYTDNVKTFKKSEQDLQQICNLIKNPEVQNYINGKRVE